jgi:DNA-binding transcriptional MerR regulator
MPESLTSPRRIAAVERQRQALELRKAGVSYAAIAERLLYRGPQSACEAVKAALRKTIQEPADDVRRLELERLDVLALAVWPQARQGNQGAIDRALKIAERRAKLLGLDAPTKQEIDVRDVDRTIERELEKLAATGQAENAGAPPATDGDEDEPAQL